MEKGERRKEDGERRMDMLKSFLSDLYVIMKHCGNLLCRFQQLVTGCFVKSACFYSQKGNRRMENGGWRTEKGGWRMEDGRPETC